MEKYLPFTNGSEKWLSHLQTDAVQAYAYDTKNGQFIQGTYGDTTFKVIQFLGIDNIYNNVNSYADKKALYTTNDTSFGTVNGTDVYKVNEYPFRTSDDGDITAFYSSGWGEFTAHTSEIDSWLTAEVDGKESVHLGDIIKTYWGDSVDAIFKTSESLMWCAEPIYIVSYSYGDEVDDPSVYPLYFESREPTVTTYQLLSTTIY